MNFEQLGTGTLHIRYCSMVNLVDFKFEFFSLKSESSLASELINIPTQQWKNQYNNWAESWVNSCLMSDPDFIQMVVSTVKKTYFTTQSETCCVSLKSLSSPPAGCCPAPMTQHLMVIAKMLYHSYGIEIRQVDNMESPQTIHVSWHRDASWLNPNSLYLAKMRKEAFRTDCTLKFGDKLFPVHSTALIPKSLYFERMFKSGCKEAQMNATIPIIMEGIEEKSVEMLLDYFYTGELNLTGASLEQIDNLVNFSSYFVLPHLEQLCFEYLCYSVHPSNLKDYIDFARYYGHEELESALVKHVKKEIHVDNVEQMLLLAKTENNERLSVTCNTAIIAAIQKIDYEPMGCGRSKNLKIFIKFLDLSIKSKSTPMLVSIIGRMRVVLNHPGYGTFLEKHIEYLALVCEYEPRFDWFSMSSVNDITTMKTELIQEVVESIKWWGTELNNKRVNWPLIEECLALANKFNLPPVKMACEKLKQDSIPLAHS